MTEARYLKAPEWNGPLNSLLIAYSEDSKRLAGIKEQYTALATALENATLLHETVHTGISAMLSEQEDIIIGLEENVACMRERLEQKGVEMA